MSIIDITRKPKRCICGAKAELQRIIFCGKRGCLAFYVKCTECDRLTHTCDTSREAVEEWNKGNCQHLTEMKI